MTIPTKVRQALYILSIVVGLAAIVIGKLDPSWAGVLNQVVAYIGGVTGITAISHVTATSQDVPDETEIEEPDISTETDTDTTPAV